MNDAWSVELRSDETSCVYCLGAPREGEVWTVTVRHSPGWPGELWECDLDSVCAAVDRLSKAEIVSIDRSGQILLNASANEEQTLVTTIPAEKGWAAYVDGARVETGTWLSAFLSLELPAGEHTVELRYTAPGLIPGMALGAGSALGLVLAIVLSKRRRQAEI